MMTLGWTINYLKAMSILVTNGFLWEKVKTVEFLESIAACDLKDGRCRQLIKVNEGMCVLKVKVISWPWPKVIYIWEFKLTFLRNCWCHFQYMFMVSFEERRNGAPPETLLLTWPKMIVKPIYDKNPLTIFFSGTSGLFSTKLVM